MVFSRIDFDTEHNVYMNAYIHENLPESNYEHTRPAIIICPGGGYTDCCPREADPIALKYLAEGYNAFVLYYSLKERAAFPEPLVDLSKAVKYIRTHSKQWNIYPDKIAVCGFSAGGHLAASIGTLWNNEEVQKLSGCVGEENRPNALILVYPVITSRYWMVPYLPRLVGDRDFKVTEKLLDCSRNVGKHTPPAFLVHTFMDDGVAVDESLEFAEAMNKNNIPFEMHVFQNGPHGLGLGTKQTCSFDMPSFKEWMRLSVLWLEGIFSNGEKFDPEKRARPIVKKP